MKTTYKEKERRYTSKGKFQNDNEDHFLHFSYQNKNQIRKIKIEKLLFKITFFLSFPCLNKALILLGDCKHEIKNLYLVNITIVFEYKI